MNVNQVINMIVRIVMRRVMRKGVNAGMDAVGKRMSRGKSGDAQPGPDAGDTMKRGKQAMRVARRVGRM